MLLSAHALVALVLAVLAAPFLIVVGPLALPVPHLAADVRHLLMRRVWPGGWLAASAGFAVLLVAAQILPVGLAMATAMRHCCQVLTSPAVTGARSRASRTPRVGEEAEVHASGSAARWLA